MKKFLLGVFTLFAGSSVFAQATDLFISEYAEGSSSNKYIEIYNGTGDSVNLANYQLWLVSNGGTWPETTNQLGGWLQNGEVLVVANSSADPAITGLANATTAYNSATFYNGDDAVGLAKDDGTGTFVLIDAVGRDGADPGTGWDVAGVTDGTGEHTLVRKPNVCSPDTSWSITSGTTAANSQWIVLPQNTWDSAGAHTANCAATPPAIPTYPIADINNVDANGEADSAGVTCWTKGVVLGVDMRGSGLQFTIWDNEGIGIFSGSNDFGYTVTEGDSVMVQGTVSQFNGLTQINPDTLYLVNSGNAIPTPTVVTSLGENTESELVRFENALVTGISGSNYELVAGMDTITMRVDSDTDVDDSLTFAIGDSLCYVIGIGGQFDNSSPYLSGYQLFPRTYMDVDTSCGGITPPPAPAIPTYDIGLLRTVDANFEVDSLNVYCAVEGIVYGADLDGNNGISFHVKDETGAINIFNFNDVDNYVVTEGDEIRVVGEVIMFNGLAEIFADSITVLSTGNCIPFPRVVEQLDESTESDYIEIRNVTLAPGQFWPAPTFNENLDIVTENGDTLVMRIDKDTYIPDSILTAPSGVFNIVGIGGQFDGSAPYDEGYQIFPMFPYDFDTIADVAPAGFVINEVGPDNQSLVADNNGDFDNWIEVYNGGTSTVDLVGMHVTGDLAAAQTGGSVARIPRCFNNAPVNLTVASGEWALLWADGELTQGPDHLDFALDGASVYPALGTPDLNTTVDSIQVPSVSTDHTYGRRTDGGTDWVTFEVGTPDASNNSGVVLSVENVTTASAFAVFPNPVEGDELFFNQVVDVTVYNALGGVVLQATQVQSINVDAFDAGMYIIRTANADVVKVVVR